MSTSTSLKRVTPFDSSSSTLLIRIEVPAVTVQHTIASCLDLIPSTYIDCVPSFLSIQDTIVATRNFRRDSVGTIISHSTIHITSAISKGYMDVK